MAARALDLTIPARDGFPLAATFFEPDGDPRGIVVVVNGATAVPRSYYAAFATWLAGRGFPTLTYDYRGIGGSRPPRLRGFPATMREWATEDMAGAFAWARKRAASARLAVVGHSSGGWLLGFLPEATDLALLVTVASQSGHWRHWEGARRWRRWLDWHVLLPVVARAWGYVPGRMGLGEDLPRNVALQWARWCRDQRFTTTEPDVDYGRIACPLVAWSFRDDAYAPPAAVDALLREFRNARIERRTISPEEAGAPVGHFGFFRPRHERLWREVEAALERVEAR